MGHYYPITLNLGGKKAVIVGGGKVAERKIAGLLAAEAVITVVSPKATEGIQQLAADGHIHWLRKFFSREDLEGALLIFAATEDRTVNQEIKAAASEGQLVSIADDPEGADFHVPAQVSRGRLNIAVSTGGASPILAGKIRRQLEEEFGEQYEDYLEFLYQARKQIIQTNDPVLKRKLLERIAEQTFLQSENREEVLEKLYEELR